MLSHKSSCNEYCSCWNSLGQPKLNIIFTGFHLNYLFSESPVLTPDLMSQGILWFPDLIVPDTTFILPVMLGVLNLTIIEVSFI